MDQHRIVSRDEWLAARKQFLIKEKELSRLRDELSRERRELPWVRIDKKYVFDGPDGETTLAGLFDGRDQLIVYHFMFAPDWRSGCKSCSFWADNFDGIVTHLKARDVTLVAVSRARPDTLADFKQRMGWKFPWYSSYRSDFNRDFGVSFPDDEVSSGGAIYNFGTQKASVGEMPGTSVFCKDSHGSVFHTYSCYSRGLDMQNTAYQYLDLVPNGRDEAELPYTMAWVKLHDEYAA